MHNLKKTYKYPNKLFCVFLFVFLFLVAISSKSFAQQTADSQNRAVQSTSASLDVKVAPGEFLPVSVKLSNFGAGQRVDVSVTYFIISDKGAEIYKTTETVAVETTNNFVKNIQIPFNTQEGLYTAKTSINYPGQVAPATTEFTFNVERKYFGLFQSQFILYASVMLFLGVATALIAYSLARRRSFSRFSPIDYSNVPPKERVFYELISDTVMDMRQKVGDRALEVASSVEGLTFDPNSGRIVKLTKNPSKIIAELVLGYEKALGKKVSFSFRRQRK